MLGQRQLCLSLLFLLLAVATTVFAEFQNDFSAYPAGAQSCLYQASNSSGCTGDTADAMNSCLCGNGGDFVTNSAKCVAAEDPGDMTSTFAVMQSSCSISGTPLSFSLADWQAQASGVTPVTSTVATATATSTASSTSTPDDGSSESLSSGARIGIIAGAVVVGLAFLAALIFFIVRHRRRRDNIEEEHLMKTNGGKSPQTPNAYSMHDPGHTSYGPSELESGQSTLNTPGMRQSWVSSADGTVSTPWSPGDLEAVKASTEPRNFHQPPPIEEVYELPGDISYSPMSPPAELSSSPPAPPPAASASSAYPTSNHSAFDYASTAPGDPRQYQAFRPR